MTEFGRSLLLKAGTTLSKVEYVKRWIVENTPILLTHVGANQFYTEVYLPDKRRHRFDLADCDGKGKDEEKILFDIAGPLCFQGDYLAKQVCNVQYGIIKDRGNLCLKWVFILLSTPPSQNFRPSYSPEMHMLQSCSYMGVQPLRNVMGSE